MQIADQLSQLNALSPLDGRYASRGDALRGLLSEAGFMAHRVEVEVAWLVALSDAGLPELPAFSQEARARLQQLVRDFSEADAARIKGIRSLVAGVAQVLVVPDLEAGNMLAKNLTFLANAEAAGIVLGARVPIILTSRADSPRSRLASCAVAAIYAHHLATQQARPLA